MMSSDRTGASDPGKLAFRFGDFLMSEVRFGVGDISYGRRMSLDTPRETFSLDATQCRDLDNYLHTAFPALGRAPMDARRAWTALLGSRDEARAGRLGMPCRSGRTGRACGREP